MKQFPFELPNRNSLIFVSAKLKSKDSGEVYFKFVLDTGCTQTTIRRTAIELLGYNKNDFIRKVAVTTGSKVDTGYEYEVKGFEALGYVVKEMKIIAKDFPVGLQIDGLLGLDFFKILRKDLTISFSERKITIS